MEPIRQHVEVPPPWISEARLPVPMHNSSATRNRTSNDHRHRGSVDQSDSARCKAEVLAEVLITLRTEPPHLHHSLTTGEVEPCGRPQGCQQIHEHVGVRLNGSERTLGEHAKVHLGTLRLI